VPDPGRDTICRVRRGGYRSRTAAARALAAVRDPYGGSGRAALTVGGWLREWVDSRHALAPSTLKSYRDHIRLYLEPGLGLILLTELNTHDLVVFYKTLARRTTTCGRTPLSAATMERLNMTLRAALNAARREGLITRNPASEIALRGLRRGETIGLRWCGLDLDRGIGYVCRQRVRLRGQLLETPPKTKTSTRLLVFDRTTTTVLRAHRARQNAECAATGVEPSGYVFTDLHRQPLRPEYLYYAFTTRSRS
jgi:integrase